MRRNPAPRAWKTQRGSTRYPCKAKHVGKRIRRQGRPYDVTTCATPKRGTTVGQYWLTPEGQAEERGHAVPKPAVSRALAREKKGGRDSKGFLARLKGRSEPSSAVRGLLPAPGPRLPEMPPMGALEAVRPQFQPSRPSFGPGTPDPRKPLGFGPGTPEPRRWFPSKAALEQPRERPIFLSNGWPHNDAALYSMPRVPIERGGIKVETRKYDSDSRFVDIVADAAPAAAVRSLQELLNDAIASAEKKFGVKTMVSNVWRRPGNEHDNVLIDQSVIVPSKATAKIVKYLLDKVPDAMRAQTGLEPDMPWPSPLMDQSVWDQAVHLRSEGKVRPAATYQAEYDRRVAKHQATMALMDDAALAAWEWPRSTEYARRLAQSGSRDYPKTMSPTERIAFNAELARRGVSDPRELDQRAMIAAQAKAPVTALERLRHTLADRAKVLLAKVDAMEAARVIYKPKAKGLRDKIPAPKWFFGTYIGSGELAEAGRVLDDLETTVDGLEHQNEPKVDVAPAVEMLASKSLLIPSTGSRIFRVPTYFSYRVYHELIAYLVTPGDVATVSARETEVLRDLREASKDRKRGEVFEFHVERAFSERRTTLKAEQIAGNLVILRPEESVASLFATVDRKRTVGHLVFLGDREVYIKIGRTAQSGQIMVRRVNDPPEAKPRQVGTFTAGWRHDTASLVKQAALATAVPGSPERPRVPEAAQPMWRPHRPEAPQPAWRSPLPDRAFTDNESNTLRTLQGHSVLRKYHVLKSGLKSEPLTESDASSLWSAVPSSGVTVGARRASFDALINRALAAYAAGYAFKGRDWLPAIGTIRDLRDLSNALASMFPPTGELTPGPLVKAGEEYEWVETEVGGARLRDRGKTMIKVYPTNNPERAAKLYVTRAGVIEDALDNVVLDSNMSTPRLKKAAVELLANSIVRADGTLVFDATPFTKPVDVSVPAASETRTQKRAPKHVDRPALPAGMASPECCGDFIVNTKDLIRVLRVFAPVIDGREANVISRNVLLVASPGAVGVAGWGSGWSEGADKPQGWTLVGVSLAAKVKTSGAIVTSVKGLLEALKTAPPEVHIDASTSAYALVNGRPVPAEGVTVETYREMPKRTWHESALIKASDLSGLLDRTAYAMSTDDTRPQLASLKLEASKGTVSLRAIATDGHRLATSLAQAKITEDVSAIVPSRMVAVLRPLIAQSHPDAIVRVGMAGDAKSPDIAFEFPGGFVRGTIMPTGFPFWEQVFPTKTKQSDRKVTVNRAQFLAVLNAVNEASKAFGVELITEGDSLVIIGHGERVTAPVTLPAKIKGAKVRQSLGVRELYLRDLVSSVNGQEIVLGFSDPLDPIVVESAETHALIMPMRV